MKIIKLLSFIGIVGLVISCNNPKSETEETVKKETIVTIENPTNKIGLSKDINFIYLNPARGDKAPMAGAIYGNIREDVPTGYIGKFKNGFSSPPHIHNITYRAIVMNGEMHNADEKAPKMWMPTGSIWTQPKGQPHITAAQGENAMAYIQIESGPYLVKPVSEAFESEEKPINIDASNMVYLGSNESKLISENSNAKIAYIWKLKNGEIGYLAKLPAEFKGKIHSFGDFFSVVISGDVNYTMPNAETTTILDQGSHFESSEEAIHNIATTNNAIIYIKTKSPFKILE